jgi:hypothetical protein
MTFVDHFLNFLIYGPLFGLCMIVIAHASTARANRRDRDRRERARREVGRYPKKTSASA